MKIKYSHRKNDDLRAWTYKAQVTHNDQLISQTYSFSYEYFMALRFGEKKTFIRGIKSKLHLSIESSLMDSESVGFMDKVSIMERWMGDD